jgi:dCMP deaminase
VQRCFLGENNKKVKPMSDSSNTFTFNYDWNIAFMQQAQLMSTRSKDPSTKVGCIIVSPSRFVLSEGYNGFPRGVADTPERLNDRAQKYPRVVHAEANAIINAGRNGAKIDNGILFVTQPPCPNCAKMIAQAGIREVFYIDLEKSKVNIASWREELAISFDIFDEVGIKYHAIPKEYLLTKEQLDSLRAKQLAGLEK